MRKHSRAASCAITLLLAGCTFLPVRRAEPPSYAAPAARPTGLPFPNWPIEPHRAQELITAGVEATNVKGAGAGVTGAEKVTLLSASADLSVDFKWKPMLPPRWWKDHLLPEVPGRLDGINNSPRKELAAWKIQQLFLDPEDYVVPESVAYCAELSTIRAEAGQVIMPTLAGTRCVLGLLSVWMQDVTLPDPLLDDERFQRDPVYAYYLSNFNLLTYLIEHHDGREGNFLVSKDDARRQVFAIDNGVALGGVWYNWFVPNWSEIRAPALRRASLDRLRAVREEDLQRSLGVVAELELDDSGVFRNVDLGPNLDEGEGVRLEGDTLQLGLTEDEIEKVWERLEDLIEDVDEGDVAVF